MSKGLYTCTLLSYFDLCYSLILQLHISYRAHTTNYTLIHIFVKATDEICPNAG